MNYSNQILQELKDGNIRFLKGQSVQCSHSSLRKIKEFAKTGQSPKAIILCCSDSRAPVEMIFDQDIGDLFVIRVAGNIVAPSLVGSVEFAASTFGTKLVVVMGHSQCGAINATIDYIENKTPIESKNIHGIVSRIKPHISCIAKRSDLSHTDKMDQAVEANVMASVDQLSHSSQIIEEMVANRKIKIVGAVLNLETAKVEFLET
ncbi:MAG: carbonic anhydrase [Rickettsiales bacterium]|jgi:carbonic anhydrase|nr:carbonic anhydrase [Rickettsiales bacterium]